MKPEAGKGYLVHFGGIEVKRPGQRPVLLEGSAPFGIGVRAVFVQRVGYKWTRLINPYTLRGGTLRTADLEHLLDAVQARPADTEHLVLLMDEKLTLMDAALALAQKTNKRLAAKRFDPSCLVTLPYTPPAWIRKAIKEALNGK